jgi:catechol 2,3-dioxygenase-like lactoylglutathione lyase family enzyme
MLTDSEAYSGFAVDDLEKAKEFYGDTLGMNVSENDAGLSLKIAGSRDILVYPKPNHSPAPFTILNFPVDDVDGVVEKLTEKGVRFERYEGFEQDDKGVMRGNGPTIAWFTDPAGNILSVIDG